MTHRYILDADNRPVPCDDILIWAQWFETTDRHVALSNLGPAKVSTVFLGLDHSFFGGPPLLFETAVIVHGDFEIADRYQTYEEAADGHELVVDWLVKHGPHSIKDFKKE